MLSTALGWRAGCIACSEQRTQVGRGGGGKEDSAIDLRHVCCKCYRLGGLSSRRTALPISLRIPGQPDQHSVYILNTIPG
jgi:hypothetical protein